MKTSTFTQVLIAATAALAATTTVEAASKYSAICVFNQPKCDGTIQLREWTPTTGGPTCTTGTCSTIPGTAASASFSFIQTCTDDIVKDAAAHLGDQSYVIVQNYAASGCTGDFSSAVAVVSDGKCYPSNDGKSSFTVTMTGDSAVSWNQYKGDNCTAEKTTKAFAAKESDGATCVMTNMKVLAVKAGSSSAATPAPSTTSSAMSEKSAVAAFGATVVALVAVAQMA